MATMSNTVVTTKVLIIEDDPNIVDLIRSNLVVRGFDTVVSAGSRVLALLEAERPDMVLLDLMLPEADGFELCRQIRERSSVAIIVVSARGGERDKVTALNMGADDYMTKPFGIEELLARILATLRRTRPAAEAPAGAAPTVITIGELTHRPGQRAGPAGRRRSPPHPDRVRPAARARRPPRQAAVPRPPAAPGLGPRLRNRDRVRPRLHQPPARQTRTTRQPPPHRHPARRGLPYGRITGAAWPGTLTDPAEWRAVGHPGYPLRVTMRLPAGLASHTIPGRRRVLTNFKAFCA